jgi:hypothetical protein
MRDPESWKQTMRDKYRVQDTKPNTTPEECRECRRPSEHRYCSRECQMKAFNRMPKVADLGIPESDQHTTTNPTCHSNKHAFCTLPIGHIDKCLFDLELAERARIERLFPCVTPEMPCDLNDPNRCWGCEVRTVIRGGDDD